MGMSTLLRSPRSTVLLAFLAVSPGVLAQTAPPISTNATCLSTDAGFYNSKGQSPCLVAAYLGASCNGGEYTVPALQPGEHYVGIEPGKTDPCLCSTVMYSTMAACSVCQNMTFIAWSGWSQSCTAVYISSFPGTINSNTSIPGWAYENVTATDDFNPAEALADHSPESTAAPQQQITLTSGITSPTIISSPAASHHSNTGAIAGGVVGGVVALALIGLALFFFLRRRASRVPSVVGSDNNTYTDKQESLLAISPYSPVPYMSSPGSHDQPKLYNPDDPSTYPLAQPAPGSPPPFANHSSAGSIPYTPPINNVGVSSGMYRGMPEV